MRLLALLALASLAGCAGPLQQDPASVLGEPLPPGAHGFELTWSGGPGEKPWSFRWPLRSAAWNGVVLALEAETPDGIEGEDHQFTLRLRTTAPGRPAYDATLRQPATYNFTYTEQVFWAADVQRVGEVEARSFVEVTSWQPDANRFAGRFLLAFEGWGAQGQPHPRTLDGRFT